MPPDRRPEPANGTEPFHFTLFKIEQNHWGDASDYGKPEMRLYGRTCPLKGGYSVCVRLADVWPYFYISYEESDCPYSIEEAKLYIQTLGRTLYEMTKHLHHQSHDTKPQPQQQPFQLLLVKGLPFYGFQKDFRLFLKVIIHQPHLKTPLINVFQLGHVQSPQGTPFRLYEAHISSAQQFMIDYNLFGMSNVDISSYDVVSATRKRTKCQLELKSHPRFIMNRCQFLSKRPIRSVIGRGLFRKDIGILDSLQSMERELQQKFGWSRTIQDDELLPSAIDELSPFLTNSANNSVDNNKYQDLLEAAPIVGNFLDYDIGATTILSEDDSFFLSDHSIILSSPLTTPTTKKTVPADVPDSYDDLPLSPGTKRLFDILEDMRCGENILASQKNQLDILKNDLPYHDALQNQHSDSEDFAFGEEDLDAIEELLLDRKDQQDIINTKDSSISSHIDPLFNVISQPNVILNEIDLPTDPVELPISKVSSPIPSKAISNAEDQLACTPGRLRYVYCEPLPSLEFLMADTTNLISAKPTFFEIGTKDRRLIHAELAGKRTVWTAPPLPLTYEEAELWLQHEQKSLISENTLKVDQRFDKWVPPEWPSSGLTFLSCHLITDVAMTALTADPRLNCILAMYVYFWDDIKKSAQALWLNNPTEKYIFEDLSRFIAENNPDILHDHRLQDSWAFIFSRAETLSIHQYPMQLSRQLKIPTKQASFQGFDMPVDTGLVSGRLIVDNWRLLRQDGTSDAGYSLNAFLSSMLSIRFPVYHPYTLHRYYTSLIPYWRAIATAHVEEQARLTTALIGECFSRTSEFARCYGLEWADIWNRGSQFRVESFLIRGAKLDHFIPWSPSPQDVRQMPAMTALPMVLEPMADFYPDPILVFDFQSLYPSIMIAFNLCFSTCLDTQILPKYPYEPPTEHITTLRNGSRFLKRTYREGLLSRLVKEILTLRLPLKQFAQKFKDTALSHRQLALKLVANVVFGYTAAGFSGRMPCPILADAIVDTGRFILESCIGYLKSRHGLKVVYGDTDSLFVLAPGRSAADALLLGKTLALELSALFPDPITLCFEKVYQPSFLLTKKRYVGRRWNTKDVYELEAKGIEIIRSDALPLTAKLMSESLNILFDAPWTLDRLQHFLEVSFKNALQGVIPFEQFILRKEYHPHSPNALITQLSLRSGRPFLPRDHVPFVVTQPSPSMIRLMDRCFLLEDYLADTTLRLDLTYYLTKQIMPPLHRLFQHISSGSFSIPSLVHEALRRHAATKFRLSAHHLLLKSHVESNVQKIQKFCANCERTLPNFPSQCIATDCHVFYKRAAIMEAFDP